MIIPHVPRGQDDGLTARHEMPGDGALDVADADDCGCVSHR
jgi:hypothetical protein